MIDQGLRFENAVLIVGGLTLFLLLVDFFHIIFWLRSSGRSKESSKDVAANPSEKPSDPPSDTPKSTNLLDSSFIGFNSFMEAIFRSIKAPFRFTKKFSGKPGRFVWHYKVVIINVLLLPVIVFLLIDMFQGPGIIWHYPSIDGSLETYEKPITVVFDRPVSAQVVQPYIFPEIEGEWKLEPMYDWMPFVKRKLQFYPKESMFPSKVFIYYAGITDVFDRTEKWEYGIDSFSVPLPGIVDVNPADKVENFAIDRGIDIALDADNGDFLDWEMEIKPKAKYVLEDTENSLSFRFNNSLSQSTKYKYKIFRTPVRYRIDTGELIERGERELIHASSFTTVKEPLFGAVTPKGEGILVHKKIRVNFDQPMDQASVEAGFSIEPKTEGEIVWESDTLLKFVPSQPLKKDTKYKVRFAEGTRSLEGGFTEKEFKHNFVTIGPVEVNSFSPGGGVSGVSVSSNVYVNFNQKVDHADAQSKFNISPSIGGSFSWNGNQMIYNPSGSFGWNTLYTVSVAKGVKTVDGLDGAQSFSTTFRTAQEVFSLAVPVYYQTLRYSCNLVATRMALAYRGIYISTGTAHAQVAKDNTPWNGSANTWGNPHVGFVGDIYGNSKGYGVYWGPISNLISGYRGNAVYTGWNRKAMLQEVRKGNPVIIWAHNGYSYAGQNISWTTPGGTNIWAVSGMHSYVVVGWVGDINNPSSVILNDPNRGRWTVSTGYFDSLWSFFSRSAVVVY